MSAVPSHFGAPQPGSAANPLALFTSFWRSRQLITRLARRDVLSRYRGSLLGIVWSFLNPLILLAAFTFVFSTVFGSRWEVGTRGGGATGEFALILFAGLIVFWFFSENVSRAPALMLENPNYIKKVVFPLEVLPWVVLLSALFHTVMSAVVLVVAHCWVSGLPPVTALLLPLVLLPIALLAVGLSWFLSSLGVYLRDVQQMMPAVITLMMFLSPIFYPLDALPERLRPLLYLNPLTFVVEQARGVLLWGTPPNWLGLVVATLLAWAVAWLGFAWFSKTRKGFADVV